MPRNEEVEIRVQHYSCDIELPKHDAEWIREHEEFIERMRPALLAALERQRDAIDRDIIGLYYRESTNEGSITSQLPTARVPVTKPCGS